MTKKIKRTRRLLFGASLLLAAEAASASFHAMQIEQVVGGVCGDPNRQAVQLRMRAAGQGSVAGAKLVAYDREGDNPVEIITFPSGVASDQTGSTILVGSSGMAIAHDPAPDFIATNLIPPSYLATGRLTFEDGAGTVYWSLSWGGVNYTGPTTGDSTNDPDGDFGPPFAGFLPFSTASALRFTGGAADQSASNSSDYAWTPGEAVLRRNDGVSAALGNCIFGDGFEARSPFAVKSTDPPDRAEEVLIGHAVTATFNRAIDPSTLHAGTFLVISSSPVGGVVTYDPASRTATFTPSSPMDYSTPHTAIVTTGVQDLEGNTLPANFSWAFTTEPDTHPPRVVSVTPAPAATGVGRASVLTASFNEDMLGSTLNPSTFTVDNGVAGSVDYDAGTMTATFTPLLPLPYSTVLTAKVDGAEDLAGNSLESPFVWTFTVEDDVTPPSVADVTPPPGAEDVPLASVLTATFDEAMDGTTINGSSFLVDNEVSGAVTYDPGTVTATFTPDGPFPHQTVLTATITTAVKDTQGNPLAADFNWNFTTEVDTTPPEIVSTDPIDAGRLVAAESVISVLFSEVMDPNTIDDSSFTLSGPGGAVSGDVTYLEESLTAVFQPSVPLSPGGIYTAALADSIRDIQGLALAAPVSWSFRTANTASRVSVDLPFDQRKPALVFNDAGDGLAAWVSYSGLASRIMYSTYSADSGNWSSISVLASDDSASSTVKPRVATNGTGFIVVWRKPSSNEMMAAVHDGAVFGSPTALGDLGTDSPDLASNGSGYAVAWRISTAFPLRAAVFDGAEWITNDLVASAASHHALASDGSGYTAVYSIEEIVYAVSHDGSGWGAAAPVSFGSIGAQTDILALGLASNGAGYAVVWSRFPAPGGFNFVSLEAVVRTAGGGWTTPSRLDSTNASQLRPVIGSNGTGYAVAWTGGGEIQASVYSGSWSSATSLSLGSNVSAAIESDGTGYAVAWKRAGGVYASVYDGSWAAETPLDTSGNAGDAQLASNGGNYGVIWHRTDDEGPFVALSSGTLWGSAEDLSEPGFTTKDPTLVADGSGGYRAAWSQDDRSIEIKRFTESWQGEIGFLWGTQAGGDASAPRLATTDAGVAMAVWEQYRRGMKSVQASVYEEGAWSRPFTVSPNGTRPDVATNGATFVTVWMDGEKINSRRYSIGGAAWDDPMTIRTASSNARTARVASNGAQYMAVWEELPGPAIRASASADGSSWAPDANLASSRSAPEIVSNGSGYGVVFAASSSSAFYGAVYDGASWGSSTFLGSRRSSFAPYNIASDGTGYGVAWEGTSGRTFARRNDGAAWAAALEISSGSGNSAPEIGSDGSGYLVVWSRFSEQYSSLFDGSGWGAPVRLPGDGHGMVASDGSGYVSVYADNDGTYDSVTAQSWAGGAWGTAGGYLETHDGDASEVRTTANGGYFSVWRRAAPPESSGEIWATSDN